MEHDNMVPELISRRKLIIRALGIPPILLFPNLYSEDDLMRVETQPARGQDTQTKSASGSLDLRYCTELLRLYWSNYHVSAAQNLLGAIEEKITILQGFVPTASGGEQSKALSLLCQYYQLASLIAGERDDFQRAFVHLHQAVAIAEEIADPELQAASLFRRGLTHTACGNVVEAFADLKRASSFEGAIATTLISRILLSTGKAQARLERKENKEILNVFEKAGNIIRDGKKEEDRHFIKVNEGNYHEHRVSALVAMGKLIEAEEELQEAHETFPADQTRRHNNIDVMQAQLALKSGKHIIATGVALRAFDVAQQLDMTRNINSLICMYSQLREGPYRKSKDVRDLGEMLRGWVKANRQMSVSRDPILFL